MKDKKFIYVVMAEPRCSSGQYVASMVEERGSIEIYHRELKQTCGLERCQALQDWPQRNPIYMAIMAWFDKYRKGIKKKISFYG